MTYRVLVTGSRTWTNLPTLVQALDELLVEHPDMVVVHGHAPSGADKLADWWARRRGVSVERYPAYWQDEGRSAGIRRNLRMVATRPDVCLAFIHDNSPGATHCAAAAQAAGIATVYLRSFTDTTEGTT